MNSRLYTIESSTTEGDYLFEVVNDGSQKGVRCRIYVSLVEMVKHLCERYTSKQRLKIYKILDKRYPRDIVKIENIVWCWPYDKFDVETGKAMAKRRVNYKIMLKRNKIKSFIKHIEKYNFSKYDMYTTRMASWDSIK